eukprot:2110988-Pleurochrysis_carterae.AAC.1
MQICCQQRGEQNHKSGRRVAWRRMPGEKLLEQRPSSAHAETKVALVHVRAISTRRLSLTKSPTSPTDVLIGFRCMKVPTHFSAAPTGLLLRMFVSRITQ